MQDIHTTVGAGGRIVIPAIFRNELNIKEGDEILISLSNGKVQIISLKQVIKKAQKTIAEYTNSTDSLVEELIAMRKEDKTL